MKNYPVSEADELLEELVYQWVEMYKKSAVSVAVLRSIRDGALWSKPLLDAVAQSTGWELTERGLYRTLKRLAANGLIVSYEKPAPKTGALRKVYGLTELGTAYLERIEPLLLGSATTPTR